MAYDKDKIKKELLNNVEEIEDITTFDDLALTVAPTRKTLYDWKFHKCDDLKARIDRNKIKVKQQLRKQWKAEGASPTLQLALYKILATNDERKALSMEYRDHTTDGEKIKEFKVEIVNSPNES